MKKPWHSRYFEVSLLASIAAIAVCAAFLVMSNVATIFKCLCSGFLGVIGLFTPLYIAVAVAFVLDPVVDFFQNETGNILKIKPIKGAFKKRVRGTAVTYIVIFLLLAAGIRLTINSVGANEVGQLSGVIEDFVGDMRNFLISVKNVLDDTGLFGDTDAIFSGITNRFSDISQRAVFSAALSITSAGGFLLNLGVGLVAAFYFLCEKERLLYRLNETAEVFLPKRVFKFVKGIALDLNGIFSGYVAGQIMDALIMTVLISAAMWILGIKYFMIIGIISGIANLILYIGSIAGFVLSVVAAAAQGTPMRALYAAIIILSLQQFDAMFIVPRVVGSRVKLHPVLVILALSVFGGMFGILGMIFAVPITAFIKQNFDRIYMEKKFRA